MDFLKDDGIFLPMINDRGRNIAYKAWIDSCVKDKVVCDIGAGTGFLSVLACQAGAKKVIAVEQDVERYQFAKSVINKIGMQDKIELINDNYLNTHINADYYVTETFGNGIFEENILSIAEHTKQFNGNLIPSQVEIFVKVYKAHPIFSVVQRESDATFFDPEINIDKNFFSVISDKVADFSKHQKLKNRSNWLNNLFRLYPTFTDLKLIETYKSDSLIVDFAKDFPKLEINIPSNVRGEQYCIFWKAKFNDIIMNAEDTWWSTPTRYIQSQKSGVKIYYEGNSWWFEW